MWSTGPILVTVWSILLFEDLFALNLLSPRDVGPAVVGLTIQRKTVSDPLLRDALRKRQTVSQTLDNELALYYANVTVGTPSQDVRLHIDTGSSDMWVNTPSSEICQYSRGPCDSTGTYSPNSSSTYNYVNGAFNVSYVDGSGATGDYATDNVGIGNNTLDSLQFGIGYDSSSPQGILGIGYVANEAQANSDGSGGTYPNMPQAMVDAGLIRTNAYSIWLDDLEANTGSILFGGVDTEKYRGSLQSLPVQTRRGQYSHFTITLSGLSLNNAGQNTNLSAGLPTPVILDTGSSITYLPSDLTNDIFEALDIQYSSRRGAGYAACSLADEDITLDFAFSSITISVNISELVINPSQAEDGGNTYDDGNSLCLFGITSLGSSTAVLGDTFLRSAYVVYDMENNEISLAQTNFDSESNSTNISEIGTGSDGVPNATDVSNPVEASATGSGPGGRTSSTTISRSGAAGLPKLSQAFLITMGIMIMIVFS